MPRKTDVLIIGGGQAGLATSRCLTELGLEHIVLERGQIAQRWYAERWDSLRLLTPNWMTRLPGFAYQGNDPNGFMRKDAMARLLTEYSRKIAAPVVTDCRVMSLRHQGARYHVTTSQGNWTARAVVIATGACDTPNVPDLARNIAPHVQQVTLDNYKSTRQIEKGGVLVVGASASGLQIASELQTAGRQVALAVGQHTRLPRRYRGQDIMLWLDHCGVLTRHRNPEADADKCAAQHSFQLIGSNPARTLDLMEFQAQGGTILGRLANADGTSLGFQNSLEHDIARAEAQQTKLLNEIDTYIARTGLSARRAQTIAPVALPSPPDHLDLTRAGVKTVIWATGYRRDYSWLDIPVFTPRGEIDQQDGITPRPGLYTMGLPLMRRTNSSFIDGVGADARFITRHIARHLGHTTARAA